MREKQPQRKKSTAHIFLACLLLFGTPAGACIYKGDLVTGIALAAVGICCYVGYRTGAVRALTAIGGVIAALFFAPQWASTVEPHLSQWFSISGLLSRVISLGIVGLGVVVVCFLLGRLLCRPFRTSAGSADGLNRWGGFLLTGAEASVGIALLLGGILIISPEQEELLVPEESATLQQRLNYQIDVVAAETRSGAIGRVLEEHNPFIKYPELNKFKEVGQTFRAISDPVAMKRVIDHPRISEIQDNPAVVEAITKLKADESLQEIIGSGEPLNGEKWMTLLNSEVVMELLDQPEFLDAASQVIEDLNLSAG